MNYVYVNYKDFVPTPIKMKRHAGKKEIYTSEDFISLDTETSHNEDRSEAWLYQWCFSYPTEDPETRLLVYGRRPSELAETLIKVSEVCGCDKTHRLIIFVHNLSYDYVYIKDALEELVGYKGDMIAIGAHKLITYTIAGLNFRCTYRLSMKSLDSWCKELGTKHKKLKGTIDYDVERFQDSPLTKKDWKYMFYDIVCLDEAVTKQLEKWKDTLQTVPLTNTGYVRREARKKFNSDKNNRSVFKGKKLTVDTYKMLRKEFAGGLTHGNRFFANKTVTGCIRHRDFASHYPSQQMCYQAPASKYCLYYDRFKGDEIEISADKLAELAKNNSLLMMVAISDLTIKPGITFPYAQASKFREGDLAIRREDVAEFVEDNGRILKMKSGICVVCVNEYDLEILLKQYNMNIDFLRIYVAAKGPFPKYLRDTVQEFFYQKSFYKAEEKRLEKEGVSKDSQEYIENHLNMMIAKGMLNSIYGMSATDIIRDEYKEDEDGLWRTPEKHNDNEIEALINDFYEKKTSFMNYELGCTTTALARKELVEFVELIGYKNFLYADTDSIFYISTPEIEEKIEARNAELRAIDDANGWYIEVNGKRTYYNQFELEDEDIVAFRFLHAKCYAYLVRKEDGTLQLEATIAGVAKHGRNGNSRVKELGAIENLAYGKVFKDCGGTSTAYINRKCEKKYLKGHLTELASAAIIVPSDKTLKDSFTIKEEADWEFWEVDYSE